MYKTILIATDGTTLAQRAVTAGLSLARDLGASVAAVTVTPAVDLAVDITTGSVQGRAIADFEKVAETSAANVLAAVAEEALVMEVACQTRHVPRRHPADGILDAATEVGADLIVIATHGRRGLNRALLGSVAGEVLARTKLPVLVIR